jgi:murein DD-endopeptidase MepM/ murein hydrolase activator NlpD
MPVMRSGARPRYRPALVVAALALVVVGSQLPADGVGAPAATDPRVRELQEAIGEASAEEAAALRDLAEIRSRRADLDAAVAAYDAQIGEIEARIGALQADIDRLTARAVELEAQAAQARVQLDAAKQKAADAAAALYRGENGGPMYGAVLDLDSVQDVFVGTKYLTHMSNVHRAEVESLAGLKLLIESLQQEANAQREQSAAAQEQARGERDRISTLRAEQQKQRDAVAQEEGRERALVASIQSQKDKFSSQLTSLQAQSKAVSGMLTTRQGKQQRGTSFSVSRPVPGPVTGSFGPRVHPILGTARQHSGVDMQAAVGQPIKAAAAGTVAFAGAKGGYGNAVIIDHGNQFSTLYGHASAIKVSIGQKVSAGQVVALAGSTGMSTGPHLHFEVRILGAPVNPAPYM